MRSLSPTASPRPGQRHEIEWACLTRSPAPSGFLDLLTLSSAPSLVALFRATSAHGVVPSRALLLSRSRSPSPAPLPSCRFDEPADRATARRLWPKPAAPLGIRHGPGSALAFRALLHARVRHRPAAFYTAARRVALLGFAPSRVLPLAGSARPSPRLPSRAWLVQARTTGRAHPSGSHFQRDWLVSLETADPPGLRCLSTITNVWFGLGSGVASSGPGVRHRPLTSHL
jgi:hypothetical protein